MKIHLIVLVVLVFFQSVFVFAQQPSGRFVAVAPPAHSEGGFPNFLWVIDTHTGEVIAYTIARAENSDGSTSWITERLLTEEEFYLRLLNEKIPND